MQGSPWQQPKGNHDAEQEEVFNDQLVFCDIADAFHLVDEQCRFLAAMTPLQPRYAKQGADNLMAVVVAQAMNHGNLRMSRSSDIRYTLRYLRAPKLQHTVHRSQNRIESYH